VVRKPFVTFTDKMMLPVIVCTKLVWKQITKWTFCDLWN